MLGGVEGQVPKKEDKRGEGYGYYWIFDNYEDAYHAKLYWVTHSTRYGIKIFKPKTVAEHYKNLAKGGYAEAGNYEELLLSVYKTLF